MIAGVILSWWRCGGRTSGVVVVERIVFQLAVAPFLPPPHPTPATPAIPSQMAAQHVYQPSAQDPTSSSTIQTTISPITGAPIISRPLLPSLSELDVAVASSHAAYLSWRTVSLAERKAIVVKAIDHLVSLAPELAEEITLQMGRSALFSSFLYSQANRGEDAGRSGTARARSVGSRSARGGSLTVRSKALADENVDEGRPAGLKRVIRRAPVGVSLLVGAWNVCPLPSSPNNRAY